MTQQQQETGEHRGKSAGPSGREIQVEVVGNVQEEGLQSSGGRDGHPVVTGLGEEAYGKEV